MDVSSVVPIKVPFSGKCLKFILKVTEWIEKYGRLPRHNELQRPAQISILIESLMAASFLQMNDVMRYLAIIIAKHRNINARILSSLPNDALNEVLLHIPIAQLFRLPESIMTEKKWFLLIHGKFHLSKRAIATLQQMGKRAQKIAQRFKGNSGVRAAARSILSPDENDAKRMAPLELGKVERGGIALAGMKEGEDVTLLSPILREGRIVDTSDRRKQVLADEHESESSTIAGNVSSTKQIHTKQPPSAADIKMKKRIAAREPQSIQRLFGVPMQGSSREQPSPYIQEKIRPQTEIVQPKEIFSPLPRTPGLRRKRLEEQNRTVSQQQRSSPLSNISHQQKRPASITPSHLKVPSLSTVEKDEEDEGEEEEEEEEEDIVAIASTGKRSRLSQSSRSRNISKEDHSASPIIEMRRKQIQALQSIKHSKRKSGLYQQVLRHSLNRPEKGISRGVATAPIRRKEVKKVSHDAWSRVEKKQRMDGGGLTAGKDEEIEEDEQEMLEASNPPQFEKVPDISMSPSSSNASSSQTFNEEDGFYTPHSPIVHLSQHHLRAPRPRSSIFWDSDRDKMPGEGTFGAGKDEEKEEEAELDEEDAERERDRRQLHERRNRPKGRYSTVEEAYSEESEKDQEVPDEEKFRLRDDDEAKSVSSFSVSEFGVSSISALSHVKTVQKTRTPHPIFLPNSYEQDNVFAETMFSSSSVEFWKRIYAQLFIQASILALPEGDIHTTSNFLGSGVPSEIAGSAALTEQSASRSNSFLRSPEGSSEGDEEEIDGLRRESRAIGSGHRRERSWMSDEDAELVEHDRHDHQIIGHHTRSSAHEDSIPSDHPHPHQLHVHPRHPHRDNQRQASTMHRVLSAISNPLPPSEHFSEGSEGEYVLPFDELPVPPEVVDSLKRERLYQNSIQNLQSALKKEKEQDQAVKGLWSPKSPISEMASTQARVLQKDHRKDVFIKFLRYVKDLSPLISSLVIRHQSPLIVSGACSSILLSGWASNLVSVDLSKVGLGPTHASSICSALMSNPSVKRLVLGNNRIRAKGCEDIARLIMNPDCHIETLHLEHNGIGPEGAQFLAEAIKYNVSLKKLSLGYNQIQEEGGIAIANALVPSDHSQRKLGKIPGRKKASTVNIVTLDLANNNLQDKGAKALGKMLKSNTSLKVLRLWDTSMSFLAGKSLLEGMEENSTLIDLGIGPNAGSSDVREKIVAICHKNKSGSLKDHLHGSEGIGVKSDEDVDVYASRRRKERDLLYGNDILWADKWYIIDEHWLDEWRTFVASDSQSAPPGPISNEHLVEKDGTPKKNKRKLYDYRGVSGQVWRLFARIYGGGPAIVRPVIDLYSPPLDD
ncbi:hypothetical protein ADUPG1_013199 [Aduncisulcus paluster]|uniref:DUSP domain-containing protein n=1 Tax=Aduncisulcus paluster TaxID=2918883 RepID=A0ABQ5K244_9EUKA|nr:hypothetical protein ADUPG1_013199 [Aduncisulcus paluster]